MARHRPATVTSDFGSGRRESHDSTPFYERFTPQTVSDDELVCPPVTVDALYCADARTMTPGQVADRSVALVVTSPPYFTGKQYETDIGSGSVPATYVEYLEMVRDVLAVCREKLEPGGRMAVNVANLGRKPYRSLSADVIAIIRMIWGCCSEARSCGRRPGEPGAAAPGARTCPRRTLSYVTSPRG
jgi:site-specific DNA-methyltransferase (adenine-specific)